MSRIISRFLRRRVMNQILGMTVALAALLQVMELLDVTSDILDRGLGVKGIVHYALLRLPSEIVIALPLGVLLGSMTSFHAMARHHEITAMRSGGIGLQRIYLFLVPVALLLAVVQFTLSQTLVPQTETQLKQWMEETDTGDDDKAPDLQWVSTSGGPLAMERHSADGRKMFKLHIFPLDADGQLQGRIRADSAQWDGAQWILHQGSEITLDNAGAKRSNFTDMSWRSNLRPEDVIRLDLAQPHLSSKMLAAVIGGERVGSEPLSYYQTVFFRSFTEPLGLLVMLLLAVPPARALDRGGGGNQMLIALGLGLGFMLCDGLLAALGTGGRMSPLLASLLAPLVFAAIGLIQLKAYDRT